MLKSITSESLQKLSAAAAQSQRLRQNINLHARLDDPVQRLCNAFEPGTYVRPHRHPQPDRWELFLVLSGSVALLIFDDDGIVMERLELAAGGPVYGVEVPQGAWHTIVSLAPGTVVFEVKPGPYSATTDKDFAAWAPPEKDRAAAQRLEAWYRGAAPGSKPPSWAAR